MFIVIIVVVAIVVTDGVVVVTEMKYHSVVKLLSRFSKDITNLSKKNFVFIKIIITYLDNV